MPRTKGKSSDDARISALSKQVARLSNFNGSMVNLPSAPPNYYRMPFKFEAWLKMSFGENFDPYSILNSTDMNSALLLKCATVRFLFMDVFVTGENYVIVQFFDQKGVQGSESGSPALLSWGTSDAQRFEVFPVGTTGQVTARRINFPAHVAETTYDVNDKVTPLFKLVGGPSASASRYAFVRAQFHAYSYLVPSEVEGMLSEGRRRYEASQLFAPICPAEGAQGFELLSKPSSSSTQNS